MRNALLVAACTSSLILCVFPRPAIAGPAALAPAESEQLLPRRRTHADPAQQYSLYLPPGYTAQRRWPVLVILDARGRGEHVVRLARDGARAQGWIVLGSHQSRSDANEIVTLQALQALLGEALQQLAADPQRIYLAGLSGTAKTLWTRVDALGPVLAGMIGSGGGRPPELGALRKAPAAFLGMAGNTDFNYQEMRDLDAALAAIGATRRLLLFDGPHGWPPPDDFNDAMDWLELMAMRDGRTARREDWISARLAADAARARDATGLARWRRIDQLTRDYRGLRDVGTWQAEAEALWRQPGVRAQLKAERRLRGDEAEATRRLDRWIARVRGRDSSGRAAMANASAELRIASLRALAGGDEVALADSARRRLERVLAFAAYYLPEEFEGKGDEVRAIAMLEFALAIEPAQPAARWRLARLHAQAGHVDQAFAALAAARALGHVDVGHLSTHPAWQRLRDDPRWQAALQPLGQARQDPR